MPIRLRLAFALVFIGIWGAISHAESSSECLQAARQASERHHVPLNVLRAIALVETGRTLNGTFIAWPWTTNVSGNGAWHDTKEAALAHILTAQKEGIESIDVGCFQINLRWHGDAFHSIEQALDPTSNAHYAAKFLSELYTEFDDWTLAAGAFHSRTPHHARRYKERFTEILNHSSEYSYQTSERPMVRNVRQNRENRFPLLRPSETPRSSNQDPSSLVPNNIRTQALF